MVKKDNTKKNSSNLIVFVVLVIAILTVAFGTLIAVEGFSAGETGNNKENSQPHLLLSGSGTVGITIEKPSEDNFK